MLLSGWLSFNFGWPSVFYVFGIVACVWSLVWFIVVQESPEFDMRMDENEKRFIMKSLERSGQVDVVKPPWRKILTSMPVLAIATAHFSYSWSFYTLVTQLPAYMNDILDFNLQKSGFVSALPYLLLSILLFVSGFLADWFQMKNYLSVTQVRKYFTNVSFFAQMIFLLLAAYFVDPVPIILCLTLSIGLGAFSLSGYLANPLDIAPQFSSIIVGYSNSFATLTGVISPVLTGYIVTTPVSNFKRSKTTLINIFSYFSRSLQLSTKSSFSSRAAFMCSEFSFTEFSPPGRFNGGRWLIDKLTFKSPQKHRQRSVINRRTSNRDTKIIISSRSPIKNRLLQNNRQPIVINAFIMTITLFIDCFIHDCVFRKL